MYQQTTASTGGSGAVSASMAARWPPADTPQATVRGVATPKLARSRARKPAAADTSSSWAGKTASPLSR